MKITEQDFARVCVKLEFICGLLATREICDPTKNSYSPLIHGQVENVLGCGAYEGQGFLAQFTKPDCTPCEDYQDINSDGDKCCMATKEKYLACPQRREEG